MKYLSTRGESAGRSFSEILLEGLAPGRRPVPAGALSAGRRGDAGALAPPRLSGAGVRAALALHRRRAARRPAQPAAPDLHRRGLRRPADRSAPAARARRVRPRPVERADAGVQGPGDAVPRPGLRVRAGAPRAHAQGARRDLGRHRQRRRVRAARQARRLGVHALAARPDEPVPAGADVQPAGSEHPQHRGRGRVRRLPGPGQGGLGRPRLQAAPGDRHRQLDQLGAPPGPGRLLLRRLVPGDRRATPTRSTSPCRPATSATSAPATSPGRWACRSAAWCSPPTRTTSSTSSSAPAATGCVRRPRRTRPRARRWTSPRPPTSSASSSTPSAAIPGAPASSSPRSSGGANSR